MAKHALYELFISLLRDSFDAENQIVKALPTVIQAVTNQHLKEALSTHLDETKGQVEQLKKIFKALNENPTGEHCAGMKGLIDECSKDIAKSVPHAVKDASIIIGCQKIEHYEIAAYGSARTLARHLSDDQTSDRVDFNDISDIIQQILDQESDADEKLTEVAEGGFFAEGVNDEAEKEKEIRKK